MVMVEGQRQKGQCVEEKWKDVVMQTVWIAVAKTVKHRNKLPYNLLQVVVELVVQWVLWVHY